MVMELAMESMELGHGEDGESHITMADELQESIATSNSTEDSFTSMMNEQSTSINANNTEYSSTLSTGGSLAGRAKKKVPTRTLRQKRGNRVYQTRIINCLKIGRIDSPTLIKLPGGKYDDFYTTPSSNTHESDGNISAFSTKNGWSAEPRNGAKTRRAIDFGTQLLKEDEEVPKESSGKLKTDTRQSGQFQLPYRCRKRKGKISCSSIKRSHHGGKNENRRIIENSIYVANNQGYLVVGSNNNISCLNKMAEINGEDVEADASCAISSPEKALKVSADEDFEKFMAVFQDTTNCLHPLRDKGRYEEFYIQAKSIALDHPKEQHIQILILIEESITLSYEKKFTKSKEAIDEGIEMISKLGVKMKNFLLVYSHVHLTGLNRRQNRLTDADKCVVTARQNDEFIPFGVARVFVAYEEASNLTKMLSLMNIDKEEPSAWQIKKEDARKSLREVISLAKRVNEDNRAIYLQRGKFCLLKLALMNLNCRTKTSRAQPVDDDSIDEAERCINEMEECEGDMSEALSVQFYNAKCDLCFRRKDFLQATNFAKQALQIAIEKNIVLEIKAIEERLEDINQLLE